MKRVSIGPCHRGLLQSQRDGILSSALAECYVASRRESARGVRVPELRLTIRLSYGVRIVGFSAIAKTLLLVTTQTVGRRITGFFTAVGGGIRLAILRIMARTK